MTPAVLETAEQRPVPSPITDDPRHLKSPKVVLRSDKENSTQDTDGSQLLWLPGMTELITHL